MHQIAVLLAWQIFATIASEHFPIIWPRQGFRPRVALHHHGEVFADDFLPLSVEGAKRLRPLSLPPSVEVGWQEEA